MHPAILTSTSKLWVEAGDTRRKLFAQDLWLTYNDSDPQDLSHYFFVAPFTTRKQLWLQPTNGKVCNGLRGNAATYQIARADFEMSTT